MRIYKEIEKSFPRLEKLFSEQQLSEFKDMRLSDLNSRNSDIGAWIRDNLLTENNGALRNHFIKNGMKQEDSMVGVIMNLFHFYITKQ